MAAGAASADLWGAMAVACQGLGRLAKAAECFMKAVKTAPENAGAWSNLAAALQLQGNHPEAEKCLRKAIRLDPGYAMAHANLGWTMKERFALDEAIQSCRRALELEPDLSIAYANLAPALIIQMRHDEAFEAYRCALDLDPQSWPQWSSYLFALNYSDTVSAEQVAEAHISWGQAHGKIPPTVMGFGSRPVERRLRIGYVSPDFREHPVGFLIEPILQYRDRSRFDVTCYSHGTKIDSITERLRTLPDTWVEVGDLNDDEVAQRIYDDRI
ncbi:MAG: tetratricopeptide repeat protein, partial [Proteobacteria bacterium]|nr:tetratricopeptide repeat protein [Pseudomonadota bacterium]